MNIREDVSLASLTTFKIGGNAKYFVQAEGMQDLQEAIAYAKDNNLKYFVLAGGSNVLFSDDGFDGLVIKMHNADVVAHGMEIMSGAGMELMSFLLFAADQNMDGGQKLMGIPGSVGGAVRGNAGAFGTEMKDIVKEVHALDIKTGKTMIFRCEECGFSYRSSIFKKNPHYIIISATFNFQEGEKNKIEREMYQTIAKRNNKQIQDIKSAGSWFINPAVDERVQKLFKQDTGHESHGGRVPAGWLLQESGVFQKRIGDIQAGVQHANYFINMGNGTADQAMQLAALAKMRVRDRFDVQLREEVVLAGF